MILVEEGIEVEVGKYYLVRCAKVVNPDGSLDDFVPIIGEPHTDPSFGVKVKHYHIDGRFATENWVNEEGKTNRILSTEVSEDWKYIDSIVVKRRKCRRKTTGIRPPSHKDSTYAPWYEKYVGKSCKGKKCPHLGTTMHLVGDKLVCPLHNLQGCPDKEVIIPLKFQ
jgi:hypothetical protein